MKLEEEGGDDDDIGGNGVNRVGGDSAEQQHQKLFSSEELSESEDLEEGLGEAGEALRQAKLKVMIEQRQNI